MTYHLFFGHTVRRRRGIAFIAVESWEPMMKTFFTSASLKIATLIVSACLHSVCSAQVQESSPDIPAIAAADQAFYTALSGRSVQAMTSVWADKPYAVNIGPKSKVMDVGWSSIRGYWERSFDFFSQISVTKSDTKIQTDGKLAWVVGIEHAVLQPSAGGEPLKFDTFSTHIFEKDNGRWLLLSHHAQMIPR